mgnify:CR=1 FL=1
MPIARCDIASMHEADSDRDREVINFLKQYIDLCMLFSGSNETVYAIDLAPLSSVFEHSLEKVLSYQVKSKIGDLYGDHGWRVIFAGSAPTLVLMPK